MTPKELYLRAAEIILLERAPDPAVRRQILEMAGRFYDALSSYGMPPVFRVRAESPLNRAVSGRLPGKGLEKTRFPRKTRGKSKQKF